MKTLRLLATLFLLAVAPSLWAYSTPNVPVDDPVYRDIDKLVAFGLIKDAIYGQRPWSRREIARMVADAMDKVDRNPPLTPDDREISEKIYASDVIDRLKERFHDELVDAGALPGDAKNIRVHPLEEVRFDYTLLDSPFRAIPASNGLGLINGVVNPLVAYREGRHYVDGNALGLETTHTAKLSPYLSLYARPRFEGLVPNTGGSDFNPLVQQAYAKFAYRNFEVEVGRDSLIWGQGEWGGLLLSNNARPLDLLRLGTDSPVTLPSILKYLGPNGFQIFFADLGPEWAFPHAILSGFKWTIKPFRFLELGFNHVVIMGGEGANDPSFLEAFGEFTGILSAVTANKRDGGATTNRLLSVDGRITFPFLRNAILYGEVGFDDTNSEISVLFEDNAMYFFGVYFPRLTQSGSTDLRLEYRHVPAGAYRHSPYNNGYTLNQRLIGDEIGPDGHGVYAKMNVDFATSSTWTLATSYENRDSDLFTSIPDSEGNVTDIVQTQDNPTEHRWLINTAFRWKLRRNLGLALSTGYERIWNFGFLQNNSADNFLGAAALTYEPGWF